MPRPKTCRKICRYPDYWSFVPEDREPESPENQRKPLETVLLMLDELETLRLIDHQGMTQEECAKAMGVSRATVTGIYENARKKVADAIVSGKRLRITGGIYQLETPEEATKMKGKGENTMRIAVTYEQEMVGQHFGRTEQFKLYDVEDGKIVSSEIIDTNGTGHGALAGFLRAADVDTLICGGIGMGARYALEEAGVKLLPGAMGNADETVESYLAGNLQYDPNTQCNHHDHEHGEGHSCGHGGHGEGHGCGSHGCHH